MSRITPLAATALLAASGGALAQSMPPEPDPTYVETEAGRVMGTAEDGVRVFRGLPYAAPPIGELRWRAPQPTQPWTGTRAAVAFEPPCPQPVPLDPLAANPGGVIGAQSEDCLYLQVFAPEDAEDAPVMVWLHGGAFFLGAGHLGSYDGTANAKDGVVTVSINYRLGPLANFVHPTLVEEAGDGPVGNYGMMDAVAALEWVQDNIEAFGGDPDNVTVAGQSAGGVMVVNLLSIPDAEGLFDKAVVQSGAFFGADRTVEEAGADAVAALEGLGVAEDASATDLRRVSAQSLVADQGTMRGFFFTEDPAFKPTTTEAALEAGRAFDVTLLIGANSGEGGFANARRLAEMMSGDEAGAWLYRFDHVPAFRQEAWSDGAIHSAELMFTFDSIDSSSWGGEGVSAQDRELATAVQDCWMAFLKAAPDAQVLECANGFAWPSYDRQGEVAVLTSEGWTVTAAASLPDGPGAD